MTDEEVVRLKAELPDVERSLALAMLPRDSADQRPAMLEIRAGTGGDEAGLFAADLYRMYEKYAAEMGWRVEMISASASDVGGFKEVVANVAGTGVFAKLKFESGVHRVQRVPVTEKRRTHPHFRSDRGGAARAHRSRRADQRRATSRSTSTAHPARVASTSTPPIPPCASPTCPPAWW